MMKAIFQAAGSDSFWGVTVSEMHSIALRAGYVIPASEWKTLVSQAKAVFFVIQTKGIVRRTKNDIVNIALMLHYGDRIPQVFHD
jgi:hypothetical protein